MAIEVGIREFKAHVSQYIDRVQEGEAITVTKRGKPVAKVVPMDINPQLATLIAQGTVEWGGGKPPLPEPVALRGTGKSAVDYVIEGRR